MRATYTNIQPAGEVIGVHYATAEAHIADANASVNVSDRMSKFKVFQCIAEIQRKYNIEENDIDNLLILIKEDIQQAVLESQIE